MSALSEVQNESYCWTDQRWLDCSWKWKRKIKWDDKQSVCQDWSSSLDWNLRFAHSTTGNNSKVHKWARIDKFIKQGRIPKFLEQNQTNTMRVRFWGRFYESNKNKRCLIANRIQRTILELDLLLFFLWLQLHIHVALHWWFVRICLST